MGFLLYVHDIETLGQSAQFLSHSAYIYKTTLGGPLLPLSFVDYRSPVRPRVRNTERHYLHITLSSIGINAHTGLQFLQNCAMASNELPTVAVNENPPESLHRCLSPNCGKSFKLAFRLTSVELRIRNKTSMRLINFREHIQRTHTKPMSCGFIRCTYRSGCQSSMKRHRLKVHQLESDVPSKIHPAPEVIATSSLCSVSSTPLPSSAPSPALSSPSDCPPSHPVSLPSGSVSSSVPATLYAVAGARPASWISTFAQQNSAAGRVSTDHSHQSPVIDLTTEDTVAIQPTAMCRRHAVWDYCDCSECDPVAQLFF